MSEGGREYEPDKDFFGTWTNAESPVSRAARLSAGEYQVAITVARGDGYEGRRFAMIVGDARQESAVQRTADRDAIERYDLCTVRVKKSGDVAAVVKGVKKVENAPMNLRRLEPMPVNP